MTATWEEEEKAKCHRRVVQQFIKEKKSDDAFSSNCVESDCLSKPCLCEFRKYEKQAHTYLLCDICHKVPIGRAYLCFQCTQDAPYIVCSSCDKDFIHPCKLPMYALDKPLGLQALDSLVSSIRCQQREQEPKRQTEQTNQFLLHPFFNWLLKNAFSGQYGNNSAESSSGAAAFSF